MSSQDMSKHFKARIERWLESAERNRNYAFKDLIEGSGDSEKLRAIVRELNIIIDTYKEVLKLLP